MMQDFKQMKSTGLDHHAPSTKLNLQFFYASMNLFNVLCLKLFTLPKVLYDEGSIRHYAFSYNPQYIWLVVGLCESFFNACVSFFCFVGTTRKFNYSSIKRNIYWIRSSTRSSSYSKTSMTSNWKLCYSIMLIFFLMYCRTQIAFQTSTFLL